MAEELYGWVLEVSCGSVVFLRLLTVGKVAFEWAVLEGVSR